MSLDDYQTAKETLNQYAHLLELEGFEVDVDDANEDLTPFYFNGNRSSGTRQPNGGFLQLLP
ncbi:hypothetical protein DPV78_007805 [Talaromyces pinophilus]|nr:hypothetical protein DPV78_007805 [Talaromyces pinophilus]